MSWRRVSRCLCPCRLTEAAGPLWSTSCLKPWPCVGRYTGQIKLSTCREHDAACVLQLMCISSLSLSQRLKGMMVDDQKCFKWAYISQINNSSCNGKIWNHPHLSDLNQSKKLKNGTCLIWKMHNDKLASFVYFFSCNINVNSLKKEKNAH